MGYLTLSRREGEQIRLTIDPGVNPEKLLQQLLRDGITINVGEIGRSQVKISIEAQADVLVLRGELCQPSATDEQPNGVRLVL